MSTTFGVEIKKDDEIITVPIARRVGKGNGKVEVYFTNDLAVLLPKFLPVVPMDNTAQGIYTVGDILKHIEEQN